MASSAGSVLSAAAAAGDGAPAAAGDLPVAAAAAGGDAGGVGEEGKGDDGRPPAVWDYEAICRFLEIKNPQENPENLAAIPDDVPTPRRWLNAEPKDPVKARWRWKLTTKFRERFDIPRILEIPHTKYELIKPHFNCYYYNKAKNGCPIFIDGPGEHDLDRMKELGVTEGDVIFHYMWMTEYLWQRIGDPADDELKTVTIYNLKGLGVFTFKGQLKACITRVMKIMEQHYPEKTHKIFITNGPGWFNWIAWPIIRTLANKQTLDKIKNFSTPNAAFQAAVGEVIDLANLPKLFGGTSDAGLEDSPEEIAMREFAYKVCADQGAAMLPHPTEHARYMALMEKKNAEAGGGGEQAKA